MKYCMGCGAKLEETDRFCPVCGMKQWVSAGAVRAQADGVADLDIPRPGPLMVWGVVLFFLLNPVGTPLAAAALLLTVIAHSGGPRAGAQLRVAHSLCVVGGAADLITAAAFLLGALVRLVSGGA